MWTVRNRPMTGGCREGGSCPNGSARSPVRRLTRAFATGLLCVRQHQRVVTEESRMKIRASLLCAAMVTGALALVSPTSAEAVQATQTTTPNVVPFAGTPDVQDGHVEEITQVGNKVILGGNFTQVTDHGSTTVLTRNRILAFDATTGVVDSTFVPSFDDQVNALLPGPTPDTVYAGGRFT